MLCPHYLLEPSEQPNGDSPLPVDGDTETELAAASKLQNPNLNPLSGPQSLLFPHVNEVPTTHHSQGSLSECVAFPTPAAQTIGERDASASNYHPAVLLDKGPERYQLSTLQTPLVRTVTNVLFQSRILKVE